MKLNELKEKFICLNCGKCCNIQDGIVYVSNYEIIKIAEFLKLDILIFRQKYIKEKDGYNILSDERHNPKCFLDKNNKCKIYEVRPKFCKIYPFTKENLLYFEKLQEEANFCEGLKKIFENEKK